MINPNLKQYKYTVGILIYHRSQALVDMGIECLSSVLSNINREETEVIIVDNGSTITSDAWEKNADQYIRFSENMGVSRGWNAILKNAKGKYITILGDDTKVRPHFLESLQESMDMPNAGMGQIYVEHLPPGIGLLECYKWPSGACFMFNRNTLDKVGYFDETIFPCNTEDWDYWIRVYKAGLKIYRNYGCSVQHLEGQTAHAPDISIEHSRLMKNLIEKHGFDPTQVFCGQESFDKYLQTSH